MLLVLRIQQADQQQLESVVMLPKHEYGEKVALNNKNNKIK